jgi:hypothetical protein
MLTILGDLGIYVRLHLKLGDGNYYSSFKFQFFKIKFKDFDFNLGVSFNCLYFAYSSVDYLVFQSFQGIEKK